MRQCCAPTPNSTQTDLEALRTEREAFGRDMEGRLQVGAWIDWTEHAPQCAHFAPNARHT